MVDESNKDSGVSKAIAKGAAWTLSIRFVNRSIGLVSTLILARLLSPSDFGVYALAMSVYALLELIGAFGFGTALIQNRGASDGHYHTAWTLNLIFALVSAASLYFVAPVAAEFLREPKLQNVLRFMCILFLIDGLRNIGIINFQRDMTFDREFRLRLLMKLGGFFVTVPLAFILKSYWAMLWGLFASTIIFTVLSYVMQPFRPRFKLSHVKDLLGFSVWLQINNFLNFFNRHIENFMLSRMVGTSAVGSLRLAKESGQLLREITQPINRAAFPGYAKVNHDKDKMRAVLCDVLSALMLGGFLIAVGIFSTAHLMVPTLLGQKWVHIVPVSKWLAISTLLMVVMVSTNHVLIALGKVYIATVVVAFRLLILIGFLLYFLPRYEVLGVAYATLCSLSIVLGLSYYLLRINVELSFRRLVYIFYKPAFASVVMAFFIAITFPNQVDAGFALQFMQLVAAAISGAMCYAIVVLALWFLESRPEGPETRLLRILQGRFGVLGWLLP